MTTCSLNHDTAHDPMHENTVTLTVTEGEWLMLGLAIEIYDPFNSHTKETLIKNFNWCECMLTDLATAKAKAAALDAATFPEMQQTTDRKRPRQPTLSAGAYRHPRKPIP